MQRGLEGLAPGGWQDDVVTHPLGDGGGGWRGRGVEAGRRRRGRLAVKGADEDVSGVVMVGGDLAGEEHSASGGEGV